MSITVKLKGEKNKKAFGWYMLALEEASLVKVENVILGEKSESGRNLKEEHLLSSSNFLSLPNFRFSHSAGGLQPV